MKRMQIIRYITALVFTFTFSSAFAAEVRYFPVPAGSLAHDVAAAPDGTVWYTAQRAGKLGILDPKNGKVEEIPLGRDSAPHGVIVGPDGAAWVTDGGQNAIARVDTHSKEVKLFPLPAGTPYTNLNTATFDKRGVLWYTGQEGYYGSVDPKSGEVKVWKAPLGRGAYGITTTPAGEVFYASLAGSHIARIDTATGQAQVIQPPTKNQGARRVWSDTKGRIWVSEWVSGNLSVYDSIAKTWKTHAPPVKSAHTYAVWVDAEDKVWTTEWTSGAIMRFDPATEKWESYRSDQSGPAVRQLQGRAGEVWGAESAHDRLVMVKYE